MGKEKINVLLTGAGGNMGGAALDLFVTPEHKQQVNLTLLDLPTEPNRKKLQPYADKHAVRIVWGDLTNYGDVLEAVTGADYVLHAAAVIPPLADHHPELAWRVNVGAARNIVRAVKSQPDPDAVRLVNIGTVAQTGDRLPPIHIGRVGDPVLPSAYDYYACSKAEAERIVAESGLKYWVSLRQTFILSFSLDHMPIMFHQPLNTCFEAIGVTDAGRVLVNATREDLPEDFWRRFYNIGGGDNTRSIYLNFLRRFLGILGLKPEEVYERKWFALRNFHCQWYEDSDVLHQFLDHQKQGLDDYFDEITRRTPWIQKSFARMVPRKLLKEMIFKPVAFKFEDSPMRWLREDPKRITAFYKGRHSMESIHHWDTGGDDVPDWTQYQRLDHGYDESKPTSELNLTDMRGAARFRGGECTSKNIPPGDLFTPLQWSCAFNHHFSMTANSVLKGGHWCPECAPPEWNIGQQAQRSPFLAQVWRHQHDLEETVCYP
ncbi:MAG: NAD(P)-dependent oxidoreductase [Anaerolineales bacterium]|nr:NAD(P)-dependent oxidoreductase [Anaerolineales bacterium]